jgi:hypothetical protein
MFFVVVFATLIDILDEKRTITNLNYLYFATCRICKFRIAQALYVYKIEIFPKYTQNGNFVSLEEPV